MSCDLLQVMHHHDAGVGESGQRSMPKVMPAKVLNSQFRDYRVPVGRVAQDRGRDPTPARAGEDSRFFRTIGGRNSALYKIADFGVRGTL